MATTVLIIVLSVIFSFKVAMTFLGILIVLLLAFSALCAFTPIGQLASQGKLDSECSLMEIKLRSGDASFSERIGFLLYFFFTQILMVPFPPVIVLALIGCGLYHWLS